MELNLYGFYISNHPVSIEKSKSGDYINLDKIDTMFNKMVRVIVMIDYIKEIVTKKNEEMAFCKVSDEFGNISLTLFPEKYEEYKKIKKGDIVKVFGRVERRFDEFQIIVDTISKI
jgi:DNA polymerase-3 subunit alpha